MDWMMIEWMMNEWINEWMNECMFEGKWVSACVGEWVNE